MVGRGRVGVGEMGDRGGWAAKYKLSLSLEHRQQFCVSVCSVAK